jgi:hypothetical protein
VQVQEQEQEQEQEQQASWLTVVCIARPATPLLPLARLHPWCIGLSTVMEIDGEAFVLCGVCPLFPAS